MAVIQTYRPARRGRRGDMRYFLALAVGAALGGAPVMAAAGQDQSPSAQAAPAPSGGMPAAPDAATIGKAGAALHDVVRVQSKYQGQWEAASGPQKQRVSDQANAEAVQAIQAHGLSVETYSNVLRVAQNDPQVKARLLAAAQSQP
ncbi:MAG TPA: DUF4168 domain-containing protein [Rhodopila sp.]|nr:DUF4168 domain-containing protein [Rhodopila sp.]